MPLLKVKRHELANCFNLRGLETRDTPGNELDRASLGAKRTGKRSARNPHATFDVHSWAHPKLSLL
jgi:hypothetical protein